MIKTFKQFVLLYGITISIVMVGFIAVIAQPPTVIGVGGMITINGTPVEDGTPVVVKNNDTGIYDNATTENGWYASRMTGNDGNIISVMVCYSGKNYWNTTVVNTSHITQFCNISIIVESGIVADAGGHYYGMEGENINLDASGSTGDIVSYTWECNGIVKHGVAVSYALDNGEYTATLTVSDGINQDTDIAVITVSNIPPSADAGDMYFGDTGEEIIFDGSGSYDAYDDLLYRWDFDGDGIWDSAWNNNSQANHVYTASGIYTVILNVTDGDAYDIDTALAVISKSNDNDIPIANFTYDIDNLTVSFIDESHDSDGFIASWTWDFGDGYTSNVQNPTHVYSDYGSYNVTLTVADDKDAINYVTKEITLINDIEVNLKPIANFTIEGILLTNHTIYMNSTSYDPDGFIVNSTWLVDENKLYDSSIEMQFSEGKHNVTLIVIDDDNANDTITKTIYIEKENINGTNSYNLTVYVMCDGIPIQGANITISDNVLQTGNDGKVVISLERGWYTVLIEKDGYKPKIEQIHLTCDKTLNVSLDKGRNTPLSIATLIIALLIALWRKYEKNH